MSPRQELASIWPDSFLSLDSTNVEHLLYKIYTTDVEIPSTILWSDMSYYNIAHVLLLDYLRTKVKQILLFTDNKTTLAWLPWDFKVYEPYISHNPTIFYKPDRYMDDFIDASQKTAIIVPEIDKNKYQQKYAAASVLSISDDLHGDFDLVLNLGLQTRSVSTITLGSILATTVQTKECHQMINCLSSNGTVIHFESKTRHVVTNENKHYHWLSLYANQAKHQFSLPLLLENEANLTLFYQKIDETFIFTTPLNYKWEYITRYFNNIDAFVIACLVSCYNDDTIIKLTPESFHWRDTSSLNVLINIWNHLLQNIDVTVKDKRITWDRDRVEMFCRQFNLNLTYFLRVEDMFNQVFFIDFEGDLEPIVDLTWLNTLTDLYFEFNVLYVLDEPTFTSDVYSDWSKQIEVKDVRKFWLDKSLINALVNIDTKTIRPIVIKPTLLFPTIAFFF